MLCHLTLKIPMVALNQDSSKHTQRLLRHSRCHGLTGCEAKSETGRHLCAPEWTCVAPLKILVKHDRRSNNCF